MNSSVDEVAIRNLAASYTDAINRRNAQEAASVYAPDGTACLDSGQVVPGDKMAKNFRNVLENLPFVFQMTHSGIVEVNGDVAKARWWLSEVQLFKGESQYRFWAGTYEDELVRLPQGWRFQHRRLTTHFTSSYAPGTQHMPPPLYVPMKTYVTQ
ncbi:MAG: nuclear transport factor 2 family protein [Spongiibacteraceae bacterium]